MNGLTSYTVLRKIFLLAIIIPQFIYVSTASGDTIVTDSERKEMNLILKKLNIGIEDGEKFDISDERRLWFLSTSDGCANDRLHNKKVNKRPCVYRYKFFIVLSDTKGNVIDSRVETKNFDRSLYDLSTPKNNNDYYRIDNQGTLAYPLHAYFGKPRPGEGSNLNLEKEIKEYSKLSLYIIENEKIKLVLKDLTVYDSRHSVIGKNCNDAENYSTYVRSLMQFSILPNKTNGYYDLSSEVYEKQYYNCDRTKSFNTEPFEIYKFDGNLYRNVNTSVVSVEKASLYDSPDTKNKTKMYLIKGDFVIIRDRKTEGGIEWILVDYDSEQLGKTLTKWMRAADVVLLFN